MKHEDSQYHNTRNVCKISTFGSNEMKKKSVKYNRKYSFIRVAHLPLLFFDGDVESGSVSARRAYI